MNIEPAVAAELAYSPSWACETAYAWLRVDDFTDPRCLAVYDAALRGWEHAGEAGRRIDPAKGSEWLDYLVAALTRALGGRDAAHEALGYVMEHGEPWCPPERYTRLCWQLAAAGSLRRVRAVLTRWSLGFSRLVAVTPEGEDFALDVLLAYDGDDTGQLSAAQSFPRIFDRGYALAGRPLEPGMDAAAALVALRAELDDAMRVAVRAPGPERETAPSIQW